MPFVFTARGRVHLSPIPLPPPNFAPLLQSKQATTKPNKPPVKSVSRRVSSSKESRRTLADIEADGDSDSEFDFSRPFDENHPFVTSYYNGEISSESEEQEDDSDGEEDVDAVLNPYKWNDPEDSFEQYLGWSMGPPPDAEEDSTEEEDKEDSSTSMMSTPALTSLPPQVSHPPHPLLLFIPAIPAVLRVRPILPLLFPAIRPLSQHEIQVYACTA